jgi:hypothetical protein
LDGHVALEVDRGADLVGPGREFDGPAPALFAAVTALLIAAASLVLPLPVAP